MLKNRLPPVHFGAAAGLMLLALRAFAGDPPAATQTAAVRDSDGPAEGCAKGSENKDIFARLRDSYRSHLAWDGADPNAPTAAVAGGAEVPESNPPWPHATWIRRPAAIGVENMYYNALMDSLYCGKGGQKLKDSRFTIYGSISRAATSAVRIRGSITRPAPAAIILRPIPSNRTRRKWIKSPFTSSARRIRST